MAAKKTKLELTSPLNRTPTVNAQVTSTNLVNKVNNNTLKTGGGGGNMTVNKVNTPSPLSTKGIGNNKTCTWLFDSGEVCGKTFSKSYNLVVHMRMHEDVRPFQCSLCDQTFRQKAHLQRHETTHGIGTRMNRTSGAAGGGGGGSSPKRKRKKSARGHTTTPTMGSVPVNATNTIQIAPPPTTTVHSSNLQERLARVNEQFGVKVKHEDEDEVMQEVVYTEAAEVKSYGGQKRKYSETEPGII